MQAVQTERQRAHAAESAASALQVEAEEALQRLVLTHRPGSPTVDIAVTELAARRNEYNETCHASKRADAAYHEELRQETLRERRRRRTDHDERVHTARHPTGAASLQREHAGEAGIDDEEGGICSGDDLLPPASKKQKAAQQACSDARRSNESENGDSNAEKSENEGSSDDERKNGDDSKGENGDSGDDPGKTPSTVGPSSSQPRTMNRLVAHLMGNLAPRAAAPTAVAGSQEAHGDENDEADNEGSDDNNVSVASDEVSARASDGDQSRQQAESPPTSEYIPSEMESSDPE